MDGNITNKGISKWQSKDFHADHCKSPAHQHAHIFSCAALPGGSALFHLKTKST